jgi:hypothetical protein
MTPLRPGTKLGPREIVARQTRGTTVMADRVSKTKRSSSSPVVPAIVSVSLASRKLNEVYNGSETVVMAYRL